MVPKGENLTAYELPVFGMLTITRDYYRHLGKRAGFSASATAPCICWWKRVKLRAFNFTSKQYTNQLFIHPSINIFPIFLNPFGRTSINQATNDRGGKDPNTNSLIFNTFLHQRPVGNCWPSQYLPIKTWYTNSKSTLIHTNPGLQPTKEMLESCFKGSRMTR